MQHSRRDYEPRRRLEPSGGRRAEPRRRLSRSERRRRSLARNGRIGVFAAALVATLVIAVTSISLAPSKALDTASAGDTTSPGFGPVKWLEHVQQRAAAHEARPVVKPKSAVDPRALPARSGTGKRVVFDMSSQRVWLVRSGDVVRRTYLVSGSEHDNLRPGRYKVYSRSRNATSFDFGSTMNYFVRFTKGPNAAIGFHDIPVSNRGRYVQSTRDLGKALSSGCVRQKRSDAQLMWRFAPVGTPVVVLA